MELRVVDTCRQGRAEIHLRSGPFLRPVTSEGPTGQGVTAKNRQEKTESSE